MSCKIAIFPIDHQTVTFARYAYLGEYKPIALVSPDLCVMDGSDISKLDGGKTANILLHANYHQKISECDIVYFMNSESVLDITIYKELITYAKQLNKKVIVSDKVHLLLKDSENLNKDLISASPNLLTIDAPIISVLTAGEKCGQPQTEFSLGEYFRGQGYEVLQIGTQEYSNLLGCLNLPSFLFDKTIQIQDKILMFNRFIYKAFKKEEPDVIIVGVPCPIMKYNDDILNGLGIFPFIIQSAIQSDVGIINLNYQEYSYEYLNNLMLFCKYRLNIETKYFGVSNTVESKNIGELDKLEYLHISSEFVKNNLKPEIGKDDYTLFPIYDKEATMKAYKKIEQELLANIDQI